MAVRSAYSQLRRKWQMVVDAFVRCGVQTDAYTEVYGDGKQADACASRLFAKPLVSQAVEERTQIAIARAGVRQVRVLEELAAIAFLDPGELFNEDNSLRKIADLPPKVRAAILAVETDELFDGVGKDREQIGITRKLKLAPKIEALKILAQHLRILEPPVVAAIVADASNLSDLDKARRVAFLLGQAVRAINAAPAAAPESGNPAGSPPAHSTKQETHS
jgi:phage terminase small subunit